MKFRTYSAVSILLIALISLTTTPMFGSPTKKERRVKEVNVETGPQVGERLKKLKNTNANVKAALAEFEKKGRHLPKLDEAVTFSGKVEETETAPVARNGSIFRQASFGRTQQITFTDTGVDVTFITAIELANEWQGTIIANFYDAAGTLTETAVHDMVITRSEYNPSEWTARYDLIVENGVPTLAVVPGMFTGFALGVPILDHQRLFGAPPPLNLEEWQFANPTQEGLYYNLYPTQRLYDTPPGGIPLLELAPVSQLSGKGMLHTTKLSLLPQIRQDSIDRRPLNQTGNISITMTGGRNFAGTVGAGLTGVAASCGIAGMFSGGVGFGPCMASRGGGLVVGSAFAFLRIHVNIY